MGSCRVATWAVFEELSWLNVHFSHFRRRRQARLLLERLPRLPRPWPVTGDFNGTSWPRWSSARILETELVDSGGGPLRIDRILASRELACERSFVVPTRVSDHDRADFRFEPPGQQAEPVQIGSLAQSGLLQPGQLRLGQASTSGPTAVSTVTRKGGLLPDQHPQAAQGAHLGVSKPSPRGAEPARRAERAMDLRFRRPAIAPGAPRHAPHSATS